MLQPKTYNLQPNNGYTYIEIMAVILLAVMLLTFSVLSYRLIGRRNETILTANQVAVDIREAEAYATSGKEYQNTKGRNVWGFTVDMANHKQYKIFADSIAVVGQTYNNFRYDNNPEEKTRTITLPREIHIKEIGYITVVNGNEVPVALDNTGKISITFTPPDPIVKIVVNNDDVNATPTLLKKGAYIKIEDQAQTTQTIIVNEYGLIDVVR